MGQSTCVGPSFRVGDVPAPEAESWLGGQELEAQVAGVGCGVRHDHQEALVARMVPDDGEGLVRDGPRDVFPVGFPPGSLFPSVEVQPSELRPLQSLQYLFVQFEIKFRSMGNALRRSGRCTRPKTQSVCRSPCSSANTHS